MARMLETVDLTRKMDRECYVREVSRRQIQFRGLGYQVYLQKRPVIIAFEIWDAAGKGGAGENNHLRSSLEPHRRK